MTLRQRAGIAAIASAVFQAVTLPLVQIDNALGHLCACLAIPALLGEIGVDRAEGKPINLSHGAGHSAYIVGFIAWFIVFWVAIGSGTRLYERFQRFRAASDESAQADDPPSS